MSDIEKCDETPGCSTEDPSSESKATGTHDDLSYSGRGTSTESETERSAVGDDILDTGSRAWITVLGAFAALFCTFGQMNAFGTFQTWYSTHQLQHLQPSTISWIGSLQLWIFFLSVRIIYPDLRERSLYLSFPILSYSREDRLAAPSMHTGLLESCHSERYCLYSAL